MRALVLLALVGGCGGVAGTPGTLGPVSAFRPEDRVLLGDFSRVNAIASGFDRVYVVYPTALGIWRPIQRRWEVPRTPPNARDLELVRAAVIDPLDQSVWLATDNGYLHYVLDADRWDRGSLPGRVTAIATNPADPARGIWFRLTTGWVVQPSFGPATAASPPRTLRSAPTVEDALRDVPQLRSLAPSFLIGPRLTTGQLTAAAPAASNTGWFLGTSNRGLLFLDRTSSAPTPLTLGLPGEVVGALLAVDDGVWVATDASVIAPAAVTFVPSDLGESITIANEGTRAPSFEATRRIVAGDRVLWLGTDRGLMRVQIEGGRTDRFDESRGMSDSRITALVQRRGRIVVGTLRGLFEVATGDSLQRLGGAFNDAVLSLDARGDTVWVGTTRGLFASIGRDGELRVPEGYRQLVGSNTSIIGVGYHGDTLLVLSGDRVMWRDPVRGSWNAGPIISSQLGRLRLLHVRDDAIWVGADRGLGLIDLLSGVIRLLGVPADLPGEVTAIATDSRYLWIGTPYGLVRMLLAR